MIVLTVNAGSSSLKFGIFERGERGVVRRGRAQIDLRHPPLILHVATEHGASDLELGTPVDAEQALDRAVAMLEDRFVPSGAGFRAVGHRIVHGGDRFAGPVRIDAEVLEALKALEPLAPLHQPQNLHAVQVLGHLRPELAQVASFDTAFHQTQSPLLRHFALPRALFDEGVKRYGFHGLSYTFIVRALRERFPTLADGRVIVAHLGSGASLCALHGGVSRDTSMGFSTLDGLPMATRCGTLDAGVVLHLLARYGHSAESLTDLLYRRSGLLGLSGVSADMRDLLQHRSTEAEEAVAFFCQKVARDIAALATTLGGLDAIVFTAGIGENQPVVREMIASHLAWLGLSLDPEANGAQAARIDSARSTIACLVIPTDEESVIASETFQCLPQERP